MGIFKRRDDETPARGEGAPARDGGPARPGAVPSWAQQMETARQLQEQAMRMQAQMTQAFATQAGVAQTGSGGGAAAGRPAGWARQVLALLAPAEPGFVKRCSCVACGAPKKLPSVTAYVYCDYCAALMDFDLRRAGEGDGPAGPGYAMAVNGAQAASRAAAASGDRVGYQALQRQVYQAYVANVPMAVSHRARNDPAYRDGYVEFMAASATARAFDPEALALEQEMKQRVMGLRYSGGMFSPTVVPESFWPVAQALERQLEVGQRLYQSAGLAALDPDHAGHLVDKLAWTGFCQGWLGMLPAEAGTELLRRANLVNEYVPVQAEDGQPRHCGGCGGEFRALPGARQVICEGCGRTINLGDAEIPCASCGATMTLPAGAEQISCPFCQSAVRRIGLR